MSATDLLWLPINLIGCHLLGKSFIGGGSIDEVLGIGAELKHRGYRVTYNLLGEHVQDEATVNRALRTTVSLILAMSDANRGNVAIKPTLYGLQISPTVFYESAQEMIRLGKGAGIEIEFDAEASKFANVTCATFSSFASKIEYRAFVRLCVQANLRDIFSLADKWNLWDKNLRIVKGSNVYEEDESVVINDEQEVRARYFSIAKKNIEKGRLPYLATMRDEAVINGIKELKIDSMFGRSKPEVQMLYGPLGRELGEELLREDWPVHIYIPFVLDWCKDEWKPYGMRRAVTIRRLFFTDKAVRRAILKELKNKFSKRRE